VKEVQARQDGREVTGSYGGYPFRGKPVLLKDTDDPADLLQFNTEVHVRRFDLQDPADLTKYEEICQMVADSRAEISYENIEFITAQANWVVLLRWIESWYSAKAEQAKEQKK